MAAILFRGNQFNLKDIQGVEPTETNGMLLSVWIIMTKNTFKQISD